MPQKDRLAGAEIPANLDKVVEFSRRMSCRCSTSWISTKIIVHVPEAELDVENTKGE
jgi:hypothetical protein